MLAGPATAQDAAAGQNAYAVCMACHQPDGSGNQPLNTPAIAGQEDWYLERQVKFGAFITFIPFPSGPWQVAQIM